MKRKNWIMTIILSILVLLTACGPGERKSQGGGEKADTSKFPVATSNNDPAVKDAVLKVAVVKDAPLVGLFNLAFFQDGADGEIIENFFKKNNYNYFLEKRGTLLTSGKAAWRIKNL